MYSRHLIWLIGIPILLGFQKDIQSSGSSTAKPTPTSQRKDSVLLAEKKPVKVVKPNKTKIHHVKKVESDLPKTIN